MSAGAGGKPILKWFRQHGWTPFKFQREAWAAYLSGHSGLVHSPTGTGKTCAVSIPALIEWLNENPSPPAWPKSVPLRVLWITPLRALASDTAQSLLAPVTDLALPWTVELRTGDTSSAARARQRERLPSVLITTPESLSLLLSPTRWSWSSFPAFGSFTGTQTVRPSRGDRVFAVGDGEVMPDHRRGNVPVFGAWSLKLNVWRSAPRSGPRGSALCRAKGRRPAGRTDGGTRSVVSRTRR